MTRDEYTMCRILVADTGRLAPDVGVNFYRAAGSEEAEKLGSGFTAAWEAFKQAYEGATESSSES